MEDVEVIVDMWEKLFDYEVALAGENKIPWVLSKFGTMCPCEGGADCEVEEYRVSKQFGNSQRILEHAEVVAINKKHVEWKCKFLKMREDGCLGEGLRLNEEPPAIATFDLYITLLSFDL